MKKGIILSFCLLVGAGLNAGRHVYPRKVIPPTCEDRAAWARGEYTPVRHTDIFDDTLIGAAMIPALPDCQPDLERAGRMCSFDARNRFKEGEIVLMKWRDGTFRFGKVLFLYDDRNIIRRRKPLSSDIGIGDA